MLDEEQCPACHAYNPIQDFDEDCGKFWKCEVCDHCWSYEGDNDEKENCW
jgi:hypothetical protein